MSRTLVPVLCLSLSACHIGLHDHIEVDGVRLPAKHEETLTLASWPPGGLTIEAHLGDLRVEPGSGPTTLTVLVHERTLGEAHAHLEGNRLVARTSDGATCAIGRVVLRAEGPLDGLTLATGMGDIALHGVQVQGHLSLATGMGDIDVHTAGAPDSVELSTGMGDVAVDTLACRRIEASSGMGDVDVSELTAAEALLSSGMGDVDVRASKGERLQAETGLGDVDLSGSSFTSRQLDSGLGRVREH